MTAGASLTSKVILERSYDPDNPNAAVLDATKWAEERWKNRSILLINSIRGELKKAHNDVDACPQIERTSLEPRALVFQPGDSNPNDTRTRNPVRSQIGRAIIHSKPPLRAANRNES
jgi:hypothetical protein